MDTNIQEKKEAPKVITDDGFGGLEDMLKDIPKPAAIVPVEKASAYDNAETGMNIGGLFGGKEGEKDEADKKKVSIPAKKLRVMLIFGVEQVSLLLAQLSHSRLNGLPEDVLERLNALKTQLQDGSLTADEQKEMSRIEKRKTEFEDFAKELSEDDMFLSFVKELLNEALELYAPEASNVEISPSHAILFCGGALILYPQVKVLAKKYGNINLNKSSFFK